jgi:hypothetical protein
MSINVKELNPGSKIMDVKCEYPKQAQPPTVIIRPDGISLPQNLNLPRILKGRIKQALERKTLDKDLEFVIEPERGVFLYIRRENVGIVFRDQTYRIQKFKLRTSELGVRKLLQVLLEY